MIELYYVIGFLNMFCFMGWYAGANSRFTDTESLEADSSNSLCFIKTVAVFFFIPSFIINALYMIPSLIVNFFTFPTVSIALIASIPSVTYIVGLAFLKNRIISAWKDRKPIHKLFDKIEKESNWVSFVFIYLLGFSTVFKVIFDLTVWM